MNLDKLPDKLPTPKNDGAGNHLYGMTLPDIELNCTNNSTINLSSLEGCSVIYIYPMTGRPDLALPENRDLIPGARGCTPQACHFRDLHDDIKQYANLFGLSSQETAYQQEAKSRLQLPFDLLSDSSFLLKQILCLPTFTIKDACFYKRMTLIAKNQKIEKIFYPVFPPDQNAGDVLEYLTQKEIEKCALSKHSVL